MPDTSLHKPILGYCFASRDKENDAQLYHAHAGDTISKATRTPPYLVVDHSLHRVILTAWPGKLWRVQVLDPAVPGSPQYLELHTNIRPDVPYTRSVAIHILEELPTAMLFGAHGQAVCDLLDQLLRLTLPQVEKLTAIDPTPMYATHSRAWNQWLAGINPTSIHLNQNHSHTLAIPTTFQNPDSPINNGFYIFSSLLQKIARQLEGDSAFELIPDGDDDDSSEMIEVFNKRWAHVFNVLVQSLMALGAPQYLTPLERNAMLAGWNTLARAMS